ncbi:unnamed protein product [Pleuronectes platessa]|uniref:Uncharacterized protein n=1 Tax=Pleuronectes platessa TaxID=8262 RepID=A0A9N7Z5R1_PLEPL|nr:unnamed protein product [Pleuronectes platessa]
MEKKTMKEWNKKGEWKRENRRHKGAAARMWRKRRLHSKGRLLVSKAEPNETLWGNRTQCIAGLSHYTTGTEDLGTDPRSAREDVRFCVSVPNDLHLPHLSPINLHPLPPPVIHCSTSPSRDREDIKQGGGMVE